MVAGEPVHGTSADLGVVSDTIMRAREIVGVAGPNRRSPQSAPLHGRVCWTLYERDGQHATAVCRLVPQLNGCLVVVDGFGSSLHWHCAGEAAANERASFLAAQMAGIGWTPQRNS